MSGISNPPTDPGALPEFVASIIRTALATIGGLLLTKGIFASQEQVTTFVGAAFVIVTLAWSIYQKINARKRLVSAIAAPVGKAAP